MPDIPYSNSITSLRARSDYKQVKAAIYLTRACQERPSATKVAAAIKAVTGHAMRKTTICALMREVFVELDGGASKKLDAMHGRRSGAETEPSEQIREPDSIFSGTAQAFRGDGPEHHAGERHVTGDYTFRSSSGNDVASVEELSITPWALAAWKFDEAADLGLYTTSRDRDSIIRADLAAAKWLLAEHDLSEIKKRAHRLLRGVVDGERIGFTLGTLRKAWDYSFVASDNTRPRRVHTSLTSTPKSAGSSAYDRLTIRADDPGSGPWYERPGRSYHTDEVTGAA